MNKLLTLIIYAISALFDSAHASGMIPFCTFSTGQNGRIDGAKYKLGEAFAASNLVAIGTTKKNGARITQVLKGDRQIQDITFVGGKCVGTACSGFSLPPNLTVLMLLNQDGSGLYKKVDGDLCPNVFEIVGGKIQIGKKQVPVNEVGTTLSNPNLIIEYF